MVCDPESYVKEEVKLLFKQNFLNYLNRFILAFVYSFTFIYVLLPKVKKIVSRIIVNLSYIHCLVARKSAESQCEV